MCCWGGLYLGRTGWKSCFPLLVCQFAAAVGVDICVRVWREVCFKNRKAWPWTIENEEGQQRQVQYLSLFKTLFGWVDVGGRSLFKFLSFCSLILLFLQLFLESHMSFLFYCNSLNTAFSWVILFLCILCFIFVFLLLQFLLLFWIRRRVF